MVDETTENQGGLFGRLLGNRRAKHEQAKAGTSGESGAGASPEDALGTQDDAAQPGVHGSEPAQADAASGESEADAKVAAETDPAQLVAAEPAAGFDQSQDGQSQDDQPQDDVPVPGAAADLFRAPAAEDAVAEPVAAVRVATTSLIFQAPDLPEVPESEDEDDEGGARTDSHRRRSRRKEGEKREGAGDPPNTVVKVRQPKAEPSNEPTKVRGSTRLEAKRQRRSMNRNAGRRRNAITEVEFQARRDAVDRKMVVRQVKDRTQIGVLEDDVLVEHYVAKAQDASLIGNVYLGKVQNVLPSMEAAFVDIGRGRNAVLYSGEVDWEHAETEGNQRRIELALKPGDSVLVQVTKDPVGHKGARLTSQISLPGRYLVYVPGGSMNGISRKLPDTERARLKKILKEALPQNAGVIVRTAAEGATEEQLKADIDRLRLQWEEILEAKEKAQAPEVLHAESDLLVKIVRDVFNEDFTKLVISGQEARKTIRRYLEQVAPDLLDRVEVYEGDDDVFAHYRIHEQIEKALERKVWLPSGGSLVIDRTEAMTVIDVNTGKFVGTGGNLEETVTKNNLEAAEEIVRQLRLRDTGGIVVIDFIDMVLESNRDLVLRRLIECLTRDRTKHQVAEVTSLGLVQMTRKKIGLGLLESFSETCEVCGGRGVVVHSEPVVKGRGGSNNHGHGERRKGRSKGAAKQQEPAAKHTLSDEAKMAVAQIAASTITQHGPEAAKGDDARRDAVAVNETQPLTKSEGESQKETKAEGTKAKATQAPERNQGERGDRSGNVDAQPKQGRGQRQKSRRPKLDLGLELPAQPRAESSAAKVPPAEAVAILDSVLENIPAPAPGERGHKRRSRRASLSTGGTTPEVTVQTEAQ